MFSISILSPGRESETPGLGRATWVVVCLRSLFYFGGVEGVPLIVSSAQIVSNSCTSYHPAEGRPGHGLFLVSYRQLGFGGPLGTRGGRVFRTHVDSDLRGLRRELYGRTIRCGTRVCSTARGFAQILPGRLLLRKPDGIVNEQGVWQIHVRRALRRYGMSFLIDALLRK